MFERIGRRLLSWPAVSLAATSASFVAASSPAHAQTVPIDIPAQSLSSALGTLSRQSNVMIVVAPELTEGRRAPAVKGQFSVSQAIEQLLRGSGLRAVPNAKGGYRIERASATVSKGSTQDGGGARASGRGDQAAVEPEPIEVVIVGSQIKGADVSGMLPVTVVDEDDMDAIAPDSGDDLFRAIPQSGEVTFNESADENANFARGDVNSVNLRGLGTGQTLVLLNGRRLVLHPGTQTENLVPVQTVNANSIPVMGVQRMEVLLDGAAAIYGSDAVAGVVNTVLKSNLESVAVSSQLNLTWDSGQASHRHHFEAGRSFNDDRTNISVFGTYFFRDFLWANERALSRSKDLRPFVEGTPFEGSASFENRSTYTLWPEFRRLTLSYAPSTTTAFVDGRQLTTSGLFHVQPATNAGCVAPAGPGICYDNSTLATAGSDDNLKYETNHLRTLSGRTQRVNLFAFLNHELDSGTEFFGELGLYYSNYQSFRAQETALVNQRLIVPADAYWNPFGPIGGPNRIPGLTGVLASGVPIEIEGARFGDAGSLAVTVRNITTRFLGGVRGSLGAFQWEAAALYSHAQTDDVQRTISLTRFQEALSRTDPSAYNPFDGGDPLNPARLDSTPNPASTVNDFLVDVSRISTTSLALADLKLSNNRLFRLPAGDIGFAAGVEFRRETFADDRDPRLDGTIAFVALDGASNGSDVMGLSPTPDTSGARNVWSAYGELAVPLVRPFMNIPLVHTFDMQLAGRAEHYDGFGWVAKPKVAASWRPFPRFQFRGSWSQGFRAPGLPQLFERGVERTNGREDWIQCEADLRAGRINSFRNCGREFTAVSNRAGSLDLEPEHSESLSLGATFQPKLPSGWGRLTLTADYWQIMQRDLIGIFGDGNHLILDYLLRVQGSFNPFVERAAPTPEQIARFAGTGLAPVGSVIRVVDDYMNLTPRTVRGIDLGLYYRPGPTPIGRFSLRINAAHLLKFYQEPDDLRQMLLDAQAAGVISSDIRVTGAEDLLEQNGRPRWRGTATVTWRHRGFGAGFYSRYVSGVDDTGASLPDGTRWRIEPFTTHNIYLEYTVGRKGGDLRGLRLRLGVTNIDDKQPPVADNLMGYWGAGHLNVGRTVYVSLRKRFR